MLLASLLLACGRAGRPAPRSRGKKGATAVSPALQKEEAQTPNCVHTIRSFDRSFFFDDDAHTGRARRQPPQPWPPACRQLLVLVCLLQLACFLDTDTDRSSLFQHPFTPIQRRRRQQRRRQQPDDCASILSGSRREDGGGGSSCYRERRRAAATATTTAASSSSSSSTAAEPAVLRCNQDDHFSCYCGDDEAVAAVLATPTPTPPTTTSTTTRRTTAAAATTSTTSATTTGRCPDDVQLRGSSQAERRYENRFRRQGNEDVGRNTGHVAGVPRREGRRSGTVHGRQGRRARAEAGLQVQVLRPTRVPRRRYVRLCVALHCVRLRRFIRQQQKRGRIPSLLLLLLRAFLQIDFSPFPSLFSTSALTNPFISFIIIIICIYIQQVSLCSYRSSKNRRIF